MKDGRIPKPTEERFHFSISHRNTNGHDVRRIEGKGYAVMMEKGEVFVSDDDISSHAAWPGHDGLSLVRLLRRLEAEAYPPTPMDQFLDAIERYVWGGR